MKKEWRAARAAESTNASLTGGDGRFRHTPVPPAHKTSIGSNHMGTNHPYTYDPSIITRASGGLPTAKGALNAHRNPGEWVPGDAPMSEAQAALLLALSKEAGEPFDGDLSKADASMRIEELQRKAGRGHPKRILEEDQVDG